MIPTGFCGETYRDWPWWALWKVGHREHLYQPLVRTKWHTFEPQITLCVGYVGDLP